METHTVSFVILDDLKPFMGPCHATFDGPVRSIAIEAAVRKLVGNVTPEADPTMSVFQKENLESNIRDIVWDLERESFWRMNRVNKYYVVAFALDYTRFEVFSKDCEKELIRWRPESDDDPVALKGIIENPDYNENPVVTFMKFLHSGRSEALNASDSDDDS